MAGAIIFVVGTATASLERVIADRVAGTWCIIVGGLMVLLLVCLIAVLLWILSAVRARGAATGVQKPSIAAWILRGSVVIVLCVGIGVAIYGLNLLALLIAMTVAISTWPQP